MRTIEQLFSQYVEYDPQRVYSAGDYILRYHGSYRSVCLLQCISSGATGPYDRLYWGVIECVKTLNGVDLGRRAAYLGSCVENITYKTGTRPDRLVERLPKFEDIFLDNPTFLA